jgi:hypothetical protein
MNRLLNNKTAKRMTLIVVAMIVFSILIWLAVAGGSIAIMALAIQDIAAVGANFWNVTWLVIGVLILGTVLFSRGSGGTK